MNLKNPFSSAKASLAAFFAAAAAANPELNFRTHNEAYPDLGLPRPEWVQNELIAEAKAKRARRSVKLLARGL